MTTADIQIPTPQNVADLATQSARLPALALIGIVGSATAPAALIRDRDGTISRVSPGDSFGKHTVAAIGGDRVILARDNRTTTLTLPGT